jgi:hypothetical protein
VNLKLVRGMVVRLAVPVDCNKVVVGEKGVIVASEGDADIDSPTTALCHFADVIIAVDRAMVEL